MLHSLNRQKGRGERIEGFSQCLVDAIFQRWPRPTPSPRLLRTCRIVSHRGEHDNHHRLENTLAAFDAAADAGVWGIELDVRWSSDLVPMVFHDLDTRRLFKRRAVVGQLSLETLKKKFPLIPTLSEVVDRYGGRQHLMMEIKSEPYPIASIQSLRMKRLLRHLSPGTDFHLMGLHPDMFGYFGFLPARAFIPIARLRIDRFSRMASTQGWGGIAGHYLLAGKKLIGRHHRRDQGVGTGFVDSRRCLFREVSRGVDWIFSNRAADIQAICKGA